VSPARSLPVVAALLALAGCHVARPSELPLEPAWIVAVKSTRMPDGEPAITHFAHHSWIDVKAGDEQSWERVEVLSESSGVRRMPIGAAVARADRRWHDREVRLLGVLQGDEARAAVERIQGLAGELEQKYRDDYLAWPGPNSNTLLADIASETPELAFLLHHNAVGKDYPGWIAAGITTTRTGVHLDTLPLGFAIGLREGVELHLLQLTFGVSFWPPRLELPFLPEIPWSSSVDTPIVEAPRADQCIWLMDASWMSGRRVDLARVRMGRARRRRAAGQLADPRARARIRRHHGEHAHDPVGTVRHRDPRLRLRGPPREDRAHAPRERPLQTRRRRRGTVEPVER
jgi:hypothetical protein